MRERGGIRRGTGSTPLSFRRVARFVRARRIQYHLSFLGSFALVVVLVAPSSTGRAAGVGECRPEESWPPQRAPEADKVLGLVNAHRLELGLASLRLSSALIDAAVWKARHMAEYNYLQHDDVAPPVTRTYEERLLACGYVSKTGVGENAASGFGFSVERVVQAWLASPGHRAAIEDPSYRVTGVGVALSPKNGLLYWTQNFGALDDAGGSGEAAPAIAPPPSAVDAVVQASGRVDLSSALITTIRKVTRTGETLEAELQLPRADTAQVLASGRVTCAARAGNRPLKERSDGYRRSRFFCTWEIPCSARAKVMRGSLVVRLLQEGTKKTSSASGDARRKESILLVYHFQQQSGTRLNRLAGRTQRSIEEEGGGQVKLSYARTTPERSCA